MKKTFIYKVTKAALCVFTAFGASAFLLTVMALCGVPMGWQIGVCSVLPGCLIIQGLISICNHERRKMKRAFIDHHVAELKKLLEEMESDEQEEECRFHEGGKCTYGDGLPECVKQLGVIDDAEPQSVMFIQGDFKVIESCEDDMKSYIETSDGLRLIFREGKYVGWYVSGEEEGGKDAE